MAESPADPSDPGYARVRQFLLYSLSLPERTLRTASGLAAGTLRESCSLLLPRAFRSGRTYSSMVQQMLDFLAEDVGRVSRAPTSDSPPPIENFVARKVVGNFLDLAGMATLHLSPMLLLAVVADVAYGSHAYLSELADELKRQGVIDPKSTIVHVDDLLEAVSSAAGQTAEALCAPPLSVEGLRQTISETRKAVAEIDPASVLPRGEVQRLWDEIHATAKREGASPLAVSSAMTLYALNKIGTLGRGALSTVKAAGRLLDRHVLAHYQEALADIRGRGLFRSVATTARPYLTAVWKNFSPSQPTLTEDLFSGRLPSRLWSFLRRCLKRGRS